MTQNINVQEKKLINLLSKNIPIFCGGHSSPAIIQVVPGLVKGTCGLHNIFHSVC